MKKTLILSGFCLGIAFPLQAWQAVNTPVVLPAEQSLQALMSKKSVRVSKSPVMPL